MVKFRILLLAFIVGISIYTVVVVVNHGLNFFPVFFGDVFAVTWRGQFNFDFLCFLILSGLWVSWRHNFSSRGLLLGFCAFILGIMFLAPYLLFASMSANGNTTELFLGKNS